MKEALEEDIGNENVLILNIPSNVIKITKFAQLEEKTQRLRHSFRELELRCQDPCQWLKITWNSSCRESDDFQPLQILAHLWYGKSTGGKISLLTFLKHAEAKFSGLCFETLHFSFL